MPRPRLLGSALLALAVCLSVSSAFPGQAAAGRAGRPTPQPQGLSAGLRAATAGECHGHAFVLTGLTGPTRCTHGPDPTPAGVDLTRPRTTAELHGASMTAATTVPCYGDGFTGKRVQAIYAVAADKPDRYADVVFLIQGWAAGVDAVVADSAAQTGGYRHVRWVIDAACQVVVQHVVLSSYGDDSLSNTESELSALGYDRTDRKYLAWVDAPNGCGISDVVGDDRSGSANANNAGPTYSRIDTPCWGAMYSTEAHELMHSLGGVQLSAPHSSGMWHCTDQQDRLCYEDGGGRPLTYPCAVGQETFYDCGHDDYFSTAAPAGSYLATHWNTADSGFLAADASGTSAAMPVTVTFTGTLSKRAPQQTFSVTGSAAGAGAASITFTKSTALSLSLVSGPSSARQTGPSGLTVSGPVSAGAISVTAALAGGASASFTLKLTYPG